PRKRAPFRSRRTVVVRGGQTEGVLMFSFSARAARGDKRALNGELQNQYSFRQVIVPPAFSMAHAMAFVNSSACFFTFPTPILPLDSHGSFRSTDTSFVSGYVSTVT